LKKICCLGGRARLRAVKKNLAQIPNDFYAVSLLWSSFALSCSSGGITGNSALSIRIRLIGGGTTTAEHVLPRMGAEANRSSSRRFTTARCLDTPPPNLPQPTGLEQDIPSYYSESIYRRRQMVRRRPRGGPATSKTPRVSQRCERTVTDLPRGAVQSRLIRNPIEKLDIRTVERVNGELRTP